MEYIPPVLINGDKVNDAQNIADAFNTSSKLVEIWTFIRKQEGMLYYF
jgi:hypothetical protein